MAVTSKRQANASRRAKTGGTAKAVDYETQKRLDAMEIQMARLGRPSGREVSNVSQGYPVCDGCGDLRHIVESCPREHGKPEEVNQIGGWELALVPEPLTPGGYQRNSEIQIKTNELFERQLGQLAKRIAKVVGRAPRQLPSDTKLNPQHQGANSSISRNANVSQVSTLRRGKVYSNFTSTSPDVEGVVVDLGEDGESDSDLEAVIIKQPKKVTFSETSKTKPNTAVTQGVEVENNTIPYPAALLEPSKKNTTKRGPQQDELWDMFKQVKINLPLLDAIRQVLAYAKYLKELCTQTRHLKIPKKLDLTDNVNAVLLGAFPPKLQDPGAPLTSVQIGELKINKVLLDHGTSVSILQGSLYDQYNFGHLQKADTIMVLADLTLKLPRGILTDVIVKVEDFYYLVDFSVLDYATSTNDRHPNVILGRPFLKTAQCVINCVTGTVDMAFGNRRLRLNIFASTIPIPINVECFMADAVEGCHPHENEGETLEPCIVCDLKQEEYELDMQQAEAQVEVYALREKMSNWSLQVESLPDHIDTQLKPSLESPPKMDLKYLPKHLKYAFAGDNNTLPIIIVAGLTEEQEQALMKVLIAHRAAIGWTIADLKGICPAIFMHKIITEE
ncbi:hypothetical protein L1987_54825 [Smallanthus sonchifolius]|uniref:Uncharacterized protein n=1 Tax=Smallanthus sonchifolius TaxID=185202 RepID=A0ACB9E8A4_9ASTR|nr:hypothetical protein L1987_54825 [Smallanthus sonchifolius]